MFFLQALTEINPASKCIVAENGKEALYILQNDLFVLPDYIFLDLNMPIMNGLKCLAEIKKTASLKDIPVILYSTSSKKEFVEESIKLGAVNFFVKPADFNGLIEYLKLFIK